MKQSGSSIIQLSFVYVGTVVGAGFATGKEIVEFFLKFGPAGIVGIIISGMMFTFLGSKMMIISRRIGAGSYRELNVFLFGRTVGPVVNGFLLLILFGVTSVLLSGAGAIFKEQLHTSAHIGILLTISICLTVLSGGIKGLFGINVLVVPMLMLFTMIVFTDSFLFYEDMGSQFWVVDFEVETDWIVSAVSYGAFNLALAQAVLVPIASELKSERQIRAGAYLGGGLLTLILIISFLSMTTLPDTLFFDVPMAHVVQIASGSIHMIYLVIIFGEIFTSVIGNIYGMEKQIRKYLKVKRIFIYLIILGIAYCISLVGYGKLLTAIYPLFGNVSIFFVLFLLLKKTPKKREEV
jgi:uncharacterized membrane protein YkvI